MQARFVLQKVGRCVDVGEPMVAVLAEPCAVFFWNGAAVERRDGRQDEFLHERPVVFAVFTNVTVGARAIVEDIDDGADDETTAFGGAFDGDRMATGGQFTERLVVERISADDRRSIDSSQQRGDGSQRDSSFGMGNMAADVTINPEYQRSMVAGYLWRTINRYRFCIERYHREYLLRSLADGWTYQCWRLD